MIDFEEYLEALKQKDDEAFAFIYNETKYGVYALILSIIKDRSLAEDIMQETYLAMLEKIDTYKLGTNFRNWLLTIARNKAIDYYRKRQREDLVDPEDLLISNEARGENAALLSEVLDLLDDNERSILLLHIVEKMKHREVSEVLNLPLGTTLWLYQRALAKIRKYEKGEN